MISRLGCAELAANTGGRLRRCWRVGMVQALGVILSILSSICLCLHPCSSTCDHAPDSNTLFFLKRNPSGKGGRTPWSLS
jgi:hypothetical protein